MRISLVVPVRDEIASIDALLDSIAAQSRRPDEVVIVDGGSTDGTPDRVRARAADFAVPLRLVDGRGPLLPGAGRNLGVEAAAHPWIAFTDAGITLDGDWLGELARAAEHHPTAGVVYGNYAPRADSRFAVCAAVAYVAPPAVSDEGACRPPVIPSSMLRKEAFERAGGFPARLRSAEDLLFMRALEAAKVEAVRAPRATVCWSTADGFRATFRRFRTYARFNLAAGLGREWQRPVLSRYLGVAGLSSLMIPLGGAAALGTFAGLCGALLGARAFVLMRRNREEFPSSGVEWLRRLGLVAAILGTIDAAMVVGSLEWLLFDRR